MALSKECQEYHLTPHGWVEGSFKGDVLGGIQGGQGTRRPGTYYRLL